MNKKQLVAAWIFAVLWGISFLVAVNSTAQAEDKFDEESLSNVQAQLEQAHLIVNHDGQSYFVPNDDYEGLKSSETNNELLGGARVAHVFGVQVFVEKESMNLGVVLICEKNEKGLRILKEVLTDEYFEGIEFQKVEGVGTWLLVRSEGGAHANNLKILAFQNGEFVTLFDKTSDGAVASEFELSEKGVPQVKVGWPNWDDPNWNYASGERLWEVHVWNGKKFVYDKALSTSSEKDLFAEAGKYVQRYHAEVKKLEQAKNDAKKKN